jgi:hypothetical protein
LIIGECPYEDCCHVHGVSIADHCPAVSRETCEGCGREYWLYHSRINARAYTVDQFSAAFDVCEERMSVRARISNG